MKKQKFFSILSLLGVLFVLFLGYSAFDHAQNRGKVIEGQVAVPDKFARHFGRVITKNREQAMQAVTFIDTDGKDHQWADFDGQYLLVNFWATWCPPCVVELPSLNKLEKKFRGSGLKVIAISLDTQRSHAEIKTFLENRTIGEFAAYFDNYGEIQKKIAMRGLPTSYLLDTKGNILHIFEGDARWYAPEAVHFFEEILNQSKLRF